MKLALATLALALVVLPRLALAVCTGGTAYEDTVCVDAPVGYWKLQEPSGTTATDSSGNGNNGTYSSGWSLNQSGPFGGAVAAVSNVDTEVMTVTSASILNFGTAAFTAEIWVKPASGGNSYGVFSKQTYGDPGWSIQGDPSSGGSGQTNVRIDNSQRAFSAPFTAGTWYLVSFKRNGTALAKFINGASSATDNTLNASYTVDTSTGVRINSPFGVNYNMAVAHAAMYSGALADARIAAHYSCGATGIGCAGAGIPQRRIIQSSWERRVPQVARLLARGIDPAIIDAPFFMAEQLNSQVELVASQYERRLAQ